MIYGIRQSVLSKATLKDILLYSQRQHGQVTRKRYHALIKQAFQDLRNDPYRAGSQERYDLKKDWYFYHLKHSRSRVSGTSIKNPRHFIAYKVEGDIVHMLNILHESMDFKQHIDEIFNDF